MNSIEHSMRHLLQDMFQAAIASAEAEPAVLRNLPDKPKGRCVVIGAGKASAAMAAALDVAWPDVDLSGVVVTRYDHAVAAGRIRIIEARHPVPDDNSLLAGREILKAVQGMSADDLVIALMSGGGSALMVAPAGQMTLEDKMAVNRALLASGAPIGEMNIVRKCLSRIKGGRLAAAAAPAKVVTLVISDVPGDDPAAVASGPTIPREGGAKEALEIVRRYKMTLPPTAMAALSDPEPEMAVAQGDVRVIASARMALLAAVNVARQHHLHPLILGDSLEGESRDLGTVMAGIAHSVRQYGDPAAAPCVLLSGGETTVTIADGKAGRGGRNTEFLLALATALNGASGIYAIAGDTDGIDGTEDAAGAIVTPSTLARARDLGLDSRRFLDGHDSYSLFSAIGDLVITGPTLTNVNDFRAVVIDHRPKASLN
ncbi:glycerate kinase [Rhizobium sp.]|jgi:glycerate 2-kinase|uniref:glycerate kinase type-2 family protein n=1 Tax=Rhizobium sp. TaxID=391 RepID=UPI000E90FD3A|nr:glycerate kinase [Rhizobium sp.]